MHQLSATGNGNLQPETDSNEYLVLEYSRQP